jgi:hypothetical protein
MWSNTPRAQYLLFFLSSHHTDKSQIFNRKACFPSKHGELVSWFAARISPSKLGSHQFSILNSDVLVVLYCSLTSWIKNAGYSNFPSLSEHQFSTLLCPQWPMWTIRPVLAWSLTFSGVWPVGKTSRRSSNRREVLWYEYLHCPPTS